jgi:RNA polymerase sigma-70 factor (sigma-E family)
MRAGGIREDAVPTLYQQVLQAQETQFAGDYDLRAGLGRYRTWLSQHTSPADGQLEASPPGASEPEAGQPLADDAWAEEPWAGEPGPDDAWAEPGNAPAAPAGHSEWSAELAVVKLYSLHYKPLVRLAAVLVRDTPTAEEVVQEAFIAMHDGWHRLKDTDKALAYLRQAVVNRARSVLRHRQVVEKNAPKPAPDMPSAEHGAMVLLERSEVVTALRALPERQREAIMLRYYVDLSEAEIAAAMGISRGAVKSHTARGMASLRSALENPPD